MKSWATVASETMATKVRKPGQVYSKKPAASAPARSSLPAITVSIVGAGRLGTALGLALAHGGYHVEAMAARRKSHARRAARLIPTKPMALSCAELDRLPASDLLFITTPDDLIGETAARIAALTEKGKKPRTALHTSGALSSDELESLREVGFRTGSMHPLVSVSEVHAGALSLRTAFFCIEGERMAVSAARRIVRCFGARSFSINTKQKALYHAAAVMASGHMVAIFDIATEMLARCGMKEREARAILMPLVQSTIDNLKEYDPAHALTGTFARADVATARRHLEAINKEKMSEALAAYTLLGRRSLRLAKKRGASAGSLNVILKLLAEGHNPKQ